MELQKIIIQGKLLYSNEKSFAQALKMYTHRIETYYKNDVIFEPEEIFNKENLTIEIPRLVRQFYEKKFKNTVALLSYCSQFAVSGFIDAWLVNEGNILIYNHLEPISEKVAVKQFIKGRDLATEAGKEQEAIDALDRAIEKYDNHAMAYERRGRVNFMLKKYHDSKRDYGKSIKIHSTNPFPYFGRAEVLMFEKDWEAAVEDFQQAIKLSVALQPIYWKARRLKALCHIKLKQYEDAEFDLKLFTKRKFKETNPNYSWLATANYYYGEVLSELENYEEALLAFEKATESELKGVKKAVAIRKKAIVKQELGQNGYISDLKEAADLGDAVAERLLSEVS